MIKIYFSNLTVAGPGVVRWGPVGYLVIPSFMVVFNELIEFVHVKVIVCPPTVKWGYWHQWADERFGVPPPKVDPGAFGGQR